MSKCGSIILFYNNISCSLLTNKIIDFIDFCSSPMGNWKYVRWCFYSLCLGLLLAEEGKETTSTGKVRILYSYPILVISFGV
jgi:hypothetical protein